jgi:AraC-like DNA-binding protein
MTIRTGTVARRRALYDEAAEIIEREYAQPIELDDVARRLATSRRQLQRAFSEAGATSFRTHVARVRMRRALELLREGSLPVRDVSCVPAWPRVMAAVKPVGTRASSRARSRSDCRIDALSTTGSVFGIARIAQ